MMDKINYSHLTSKTSTMIKLQSAQQTDCQALETTVLGARVVELDMQRLETMD